MNEPAMPLLVSVRDAQEARDALAAGAHWIDLKEPRRGSLGRVDETTARDIVNTVAGRAPVSAAAGELDAWSAAPPRALLELEGIGLIKLGVSCCAGSNWLQRWQVVERQIADEGKRLAAVVYADRSLARSPSAEEVIAAAEGRCPWILWDTFDKSGGSLLAHVTRDALYAQLSAARRAGCRTAVAGGLTAAALERLPLDVIDMIAVRGAACQTSRDSSVCRDRVTALRRALDGLVSGIAGDRGPRGRVT